MRLTACPRRLILLRRPKITAAMLAVNGVISTILNIRRMMLQNRYTQGKSIRGMYVQSKLRFNCPVSIADHPPYCDSTKTSASFSSVLPFTTFRVLFCCISLSIDKWNPNKKRNNIYVVLQNHHFKQNGLLTQNINLLHHRNNKYNVCTQRNHTQKNGLKLIVKSIA